MAEALTEAAEVAEEEKEEEAEEVAEVAEMAKHAGTTKQQRDACLKRDAGMSIQTPQPLLQLPNLKQQNRLLQIQIVTKTGTMIKQPLKQTGHMPLNQTRQIKQLKQTGQMPLKQTGEIMDGKLPAGQTQRGKICATQIRRLDC
jgi:hypothetical protein